MGFRWLLVEKALLVCVLLDLGLGGNGYLIHIEGFRLREIFFVLCLGWVALRLTVIEPIRLDGFSGWLCVAFVLSTALGTAIGYASGASNAALFAELKPLSYFGMFPFFIVAIRNGADVRLTALILVVCGVALAVLYLLLLSVLALNLITHVEVYRFLHVSDEFIFRHNPLGPFIGFFYKGAFYICVAAIFLLFDPYRTSKILATLCIVAISMTITRGVAGALLAAITLGLFCAFDFKRKALLIGQGILLVAVLFLAHASETALMVTEELSSQQIEQSPPEPSLLELAMRPSDSQRWADLRYIADHVTPRIALVGRGLGMPINNRTRIELTYAEIFYKQGLLGLSLWSVIFVYLLALYRRTALVDKTIAAAFLLCGIFVFVATMSNTFLTGSIGMAVVFIATASLLALSKQSQYEAGRQDYTPCWYRPFWRLPETILADRDRTPA
jgi:hypothetical protein